MKVIIKHFWTLIINTLACEVKYSIWRYSAEIPSYKLSRGLRNVPSAMEPQELPLKFWNVVQHFPPKYNLIGIDTRKFSKNDAAKYASHKPTIYLTTN